MIVIEPYKQRHNGLWAARITVTEAVAPCEQPKTKVFQFKEWASLTAMLTTIGEQTESGGFGVYP